MDKLSATLTNGFVNTFRDLLQRVHLCAESLTEEQFWKKPFLYGNSFGHLTLHLTGNLSYYIGAQIANSGYQRDREREFTESAPPSKEQALRQLDEAVALVISTLEQQTVESWSADYQAVNASDFVNDRFSGFLRCATHFHHHVGQMIYLEKSFQHDSK